MGSCSIRSRRGRMCPCRCRRRVRSNTYGPELGFGGLSPGRSQTTGQGNRSATPIQWAAVAPSDCTWFKNCGETARLETARKPLAVAGRRWRSQRTPSAAAHAHVLRLGCIPKSDAFSHSLDASGRRESFCPKHVLESVRGGRVWHRRSRFYETNSTGDAKEGLLRVVDVSTRDSAQFVDGDWCEW